MDRPACRATSPPYVLLRSCAPCERTGKTTVASIYGRVLRDLGLLSKGEVVVKVPADFIGSVLGESEKKTQVQQHRAVASGSWPPDRSFPGVAVVRGPAVRSRRPASVQCTPVHV